MQAPRARQSVSSVVVIWNLGPCRAESSAGEPLPGMRGSMRASADDFAVGHGKAAKPGPKSVQPGRTIRHLAASRRR